MTQKKRLLSGRFNKIKGVSRYQNKYRFEQEAARRAEAMLAESQRISHLGSWDWDLATDKIQFSDEMFRLVGMIPEQGELNREIFRKFLHPDEAEQILCEFQKGLSYQNTGIEHQVIMPDGEIRTMQTRIKTYRDENGVPLRLLGSTQDITGHKNLENNLRESEWRSRLISELTTDYIFVLDVTANGSFKVRWISENMLRLTGWSIEDLADPAGWGDLFHPEDRAPFFDFIGQVLSRAYMGSIECRTFHKEGYVRWVRIFARPEVNAENKIIAIVGAVKDISESKKAEKALLESEKKYRFLVENVRDVIWQVSPDLRFTYVSHVGKFHGDYQAEEVLGKSIFDFMTPEAKSRVLKTIDIRQKFLQRGERVGDAVFEVEYVLKNGKTIWTEVSSNPVYDDAGHLIYFQGVARDITQRKQIEKLLRDSETRNRVLVETIPDLMFIQDRAGVYVDYHARNLQLLVAPPELFLGRTTLEVLPFEPGAELQAKFDLAFQTGEMQTHEYTLDVPGGKRHFETRMITYDKNRLLSIVRDITERKLMEQKLINMEGFQRILLNATELTSIILLDCKETVLAINEYGAKLIGKSRDDIVGHFIFELFPVDTVETKLLLEERRKYFYGVIHTAKPVIFEDSRQGIWFENNLYPILDAEGNVVQVAVYARDISRYKEVEQLLRSSERRYRDLAEASRDMIFVIDREGCFAYINNFAAQQFGVRPEVFIGQPYSNWLAGPVVKSFSGHLEQVFDAGVPYYSEGDFVFPAGKSYLSTWLVPLKNSDGVIESVLGVSHDISRLKKMERALLEVNLNLEAKVEERTRELLASRDQLRELTRQIVSAQENERHRISRELHDEAGQSLVGLRFSLDSIYREIPKGYPKIRKRMKQSLTLVDQTLSRLRTLAYELRPPMLDLMGIYLSIKQLCQDFSEQTGIRVEFSGYVLEGLEDEISISLYRFVQEALTNVAKHANATRIQVVLDYRDGIIVTSVRDDGQGISGNWKPGLGLTGIKERFDFLGGQMEIKPGKLKGTLIQICLPWEERGQLP